MMQPLQSNKPSTYAVVGPCPGQAGVSESAEKMGTVLAVCDKRDGQPYIEKKYSRKQIKKGQFRQVKKLLGSFWDNGKPMACIQNMYASFVNEQKTRASIILDYCDQGSLSELIDQHRQVNRPIPEKFLWKIFTSVTKALRHLHRLEPPVLHRNIIPENILFKSEDQPTPSICIAGFEFAARDLASGYRVDSDEDLDTGNSDTANEPSINTNHQPPEHPEYHAASDIWQVGRLIQQAASFGTGNIPGTYSSVLKAAIMACTLQDPHKRPSAELLKEMLDHARRHDVVLESNTVILFPRAYVPHEHPRRYGQSFGHGPRHLPRGSLPDQPFSGAHFPRGFFSQ